MTRKALLTGLLAAFGLAITSTAQAVFIGNDQGGAEFPQGAVSFADTVVEYAPGEVGGDPTEPHRGAFNALRLPDYTGINGCSSQADCSFVSLGDGGSIVLQFTDNKLTGSNDAALDLWIFEIGPDVEDTLVDISMNGTDWYSVGKVFGTTAGIDIDAFGFTASDRFAFIRLTDVTGEGAQNGTTVGADIDAVGAISTVLTPVPAPATSLLMGGGLLALLGLRRRRRR